MHTTFSAITIPARDALAALSDDTKRKVIDLITSLTIGAGCLAAVAYLELGNLLAMVLQTTVHIFLTPVLADLLATHLF